MMGMQQETYDYDIIIWIVVQQIRDELWLG